MIELVGFGLLFVVSLVIVCLRRRDKIRARRDTPNYRYYWLALVALRTAMILGTIVAAPYFYWLGLLILLYFVAAIIVLIPSTVALISLLVYCPRVASRGGNIAFRWLSLALAVVIAFAVYRVCQTTGAEVDKAVRYVERPAFVEPASARA